MTTTTGYIDLQINGYHGVDFNRDGLTAEQLHETCVRLEADGVAGILATVITDDLDRMCDRLAAIVRHRECDDLAKRMIVGLHIEGPFLNETPGYRGAHPADAMGPANVDDMDRLLDAAGGLTRIVTLAPERDPGMLVTRYLADKGVVVSAGHCDPTMDELRAGIDAGLRMFTHLGNGCPMQMHRHENIVQRVLSLAEHLTISFIPDGAHVAFEALGNYLRCAGLDNCVIVTDAISAAGLGPGRYTLARWDIVIGDDMVARAPDGSHLLGAAITMKQSHVNLVERLGLSDADARRLLVENPKRVIGLGGGD